MSNAISQENKKDTAAGLKSKAVELTSRVARKPITIPSGVEIKVEGSNLVVKGPKGKVDFLLHEDISIVLEASLLAVSIKSDSSYCRPGSGRRLRKSIAGTTRANIANLIHGVTNLFETKLQLIGVGYKAQSKGTVLGLTLGKSHPVNFDVPEGITIETPAPTEILIKGINKDLVGLVAAKIRKLRSPEPYKGKGIRYANEKIILKETKKK